MRIVDDSKNKDKYIDWGMQGVLLTHLLIILLEKPREEIK